MNHFYSFGIVLFLIIMLLFPAVATEGAADGMTLWWTILFPSLFPFFVLSHLLASAGWVKAASVFLQPVIRPLFRTGGSGAVVFLLGMTSGFPVGAKLTVQLLHNGRLSLQEAQRLLCFTNGASPLFIISAVSAGMLQSAEAGYLLTGIHLTASVIIGIAAGRMIRLQHGHLVTAGPDVSEKRNPGFTEAITQSVQQLITIGGIIVFFSVVARFTEHLLVTVPMQNQPVVSSVVIGLIEMTNGVSTLGSTALSIELKCLIAIVLVSFGGCSIHAQVFSIIDGTPLSYRVFLLAKGCHAVISGGLYIGWIMLFPSFHTKSEETMAPVLSSGQWNSIGLPFTLVMLILASVLLSAALFRTADKSV